MQYSAVDAVLALDYVQPGVGTWDFALPASVIDGYRADRATAVVPGVPLALVRAADTAEVQATVRVAARLGTPIVTRGLGTGLSGGSSAIDGCIVLSTERMRATMGTDEFIWHGYTDLWLDGAWRKATPAFNVELCERFALLPLDFDGHADSIYHPLDLAGNRHMEYLRERGSFVEMPLGQILADFRATYPRCLRESDAASALGQADFLADVAREPGTAP